MTFKPQPIHLGLKSEASLLLHLLLKRYIIANKPAIANTASNHGVPSFSSGVSVGVGVTFGVKYISSI